MNLQKVSIIGLGFVGGSMYKSFSVKGVKENKNLFGYDKFKDGGIGKFEDSLKCDILFLALPTKYNNKLGQYDKRPIIETCELLTENNYDGVIVIKSTVEPETTNNLSLDYPDLQFIHNPEFLTARTAYEDFHNQKHIVLGRGPTCSENNLLKVKDFYNLYNKVKDMMLKNGWINPMHTTIPGPDGQISYGGLCFPKDTNALNKYMIREGTANKVLEATIEERNEMRNDNDNCD